MNPHPTLNIMHSYMGYIVVSGYLFVDLFRFAIVFPFWESKHFRTQKSLWAGTSVSRAKGTDLRQASPIRVRSPAVPQRPSASRLRVALPLMTPAPPPFSLASFTTTIPLR